MRPRTQSDEIIIGLLSMVASVVAFLWYYHSREILLYGDAVAHLNIARRVVDSLTPGLLQLGTVWLPFPHVLMLPLVWIDRLWQSGIAGTIPSMVGYVVGTMGILRFGKTVASPLAGRVGSLIYAANPNLLYMQATPMTESIFLATAIWATVYLAQLALALRANDEGAAREAFLKSASAFLLASMTRYDGWFLGLCAVAMVVCLYAAAREHMQRALAGTIRNWLLLMALGPVLWLSYNAWTFGNPFEFATGPYSARAIAARTSHAGDPPHPGHHHLKTAAVYFLKVSRLNLSDGKREWWLFIPAVIGGLLSLVNPRARLTLFLWLPLPFYMLSIGYGGVPIFHPEWWPFSYYNVRYGLELLPAVAICCGLLLESMRPVVANRTAQRSILVLMLGATAGSYVTTWRHVPICLREARVNAVTRVAFENRLAEELRKLPADATVLMYTSSYVGALQSAGIHLRRVVNEGNYRIWERALDDPRSAADFIVAIDNDPVASAVARHPAGLTAVASVYTAGKPLATIYRAESR